MKSLLERFVCWVSLKYFFPIFDYIGWFLFGWSRNRIRSRLKGYTALVRYISCSVAEPKLIYFGSNFGSGSTFPFILAPAPTLASPPAIYCNLN